MSTSIRAARAAEFSKISMLKVLRNDLEKETRNATFACGGSIPIIKATPNTITTTQSDATASEPELTSPVSSVMVRFDSKGGTTKVVLPTVDEKDALQALVTACQPATFGRGNEVTLPNMYLNLID